MMRPLIGIIATPDLDAEDGMEYARLRMTYVRAMDGAGALPVLIPLMHESALKDVLGRLDGIVFLGGVDIDPSRYGATRDATTVVNPELDELDFAAAEWALNADVPVLGICRGQQVLNVALGGSLIQDVPRHPHSHTRTAFGHPIAIEPDSRLAQLVGAHAAEVNSLHHQALDALGRDLRAVAWAPDGTVEAIEGTRHPWLVAVQFHPEDMVPAHAESKKLLEAFVETCQARMRSPAVALR
ncbi:MAG: gamma-glutamyl-gamma-aminobutyrate hydrolase family protein [Chloroflexi bacterium]|nr:gamma-glutamyl-gamma-aminobutyrate hydrolase family protein [Chloroflexota bacterium]